MLENIEHPIEVTQELCFFFFLKADDNHVIHGKNKKKELNVGLRVELHNKFKTLMFIVTGVETCHDERGD